MLQLGVPWQAEEFGKLAVGDNDAVRVVEHTQAVRHIAERRVKSVGEQRHLALGNHGIEKVMAQAFTDECNGHKE